MSTNNAKKTAGESVDGKKTATQAKKKGFFARRNEKRSGEAAGDKAKKNTLNNLVSRSPKNSLSVLGKKNTDGIHTGRNESFWQRIATISGVLGFISMIWLVVFVPRTNDFVQNVGELRLLAQEIVADTETATSSFDEAQVNASLQDISKNKQQFNDVLKSVVGFQGSSPKIQSVRKDWASVDAQLNNILSQKDNVIELNTLNNEMFQTIDEIKVFYNEVVNQMLNDGASASQAVLAKNQVILVERILRSIGIVAGGSRGAFDSADDFVSATEYFGTVLDGELNGNNGLNIQRINQPTVREQLGIVEEIYNNSLQPSVARIAALAQDIEGVRNSAADINQKASNISDTLGTTTTGLTSQLGILIPSLILLLSFLAGMYAIYKLIQLRSLLDRKRSEEDALRQRKEAEIEIQRAEKIQKENDRNQTAILRLLDELGDLADGDLTVNATVSEDFTGAIADSVNFAIDQLRLLVSAINDTAIKVSHSSEETQNTAMQLAESSEHQAQEIAGASAAINEMAVSIDQVSANAVESATVADRSVAIAYNGAEVVQRSIDGMNTIREQIQETAKRIKRLGESSQEIGDIISLINDIADQTNILALNAAIQASTAGEAGRGFAVVADEVQRLAERSANATKQIETLVKTIQADTNEAVSSMELTTAEVVKGAKLAKDAGEALDEVQSVSNVLADLIQNISNAARQQAASAGHISNTMNIIQEITTQTTAGTIATARSVGQLNEMASNLRESVSGFKLPENDDRAALSVS